MRQIPVRCNQELIKSAVRLDGRTRDSYRPLSISFGPDFGCCLATMGNTKVLTQISSTIAEPRLTRPSEGVVNIRVDLALLGNVNYDTTRNSEDCVQLTRLLHKGIKEARCIDLESLCIISGEKVWHIQADVIIINHEGNLIEAASISALAALAHYKRPVVSIDNGQVTQHDKKEPVTFSLIHFPFLMKFAFFKEATISYVDPSEDEERFCDGYLIVGANIFKEITLLHISGKSLISKEHIFERCNYAVKRTRELNRIIREALLEDQQKRLDKSYRGNIYENLAKVYN